MSPYHIWYYIIRTLYVYIPQLVLYYISIDKLLECSDFQLSYISVTCNNLSDTNCGVEFLLKTFYNVICRVHCAAESDCLYYQLICRCIWNTRCTYLCSQLKMWLLPKSDSMCRRHFRCIPESSWSGKKIIGGTSFLKCCSMMWKPTLLNNSCQPWTGPTFCSTDFFATYFGSVFDSWIRLNDVTT